MHDNHQPRESAWSKTKSTTHQQSQANNSVAAAEQVIAARETAHLQALKACPLYSPQTARPRAPRGQAHSASKTCPYETTFDDKERRFPMYNGDRRLQINSELRHMDTLSSAEDVRLSDEVEQLYDVCTDSYLLW